MIIFVRMQLVRVRDFRRACSAPCAYGFFVQSARVLRLPVHRDLIARLGSRASPRGPVVRGRVETPTPSSGAGLAPAGGADYARLKLWTRSLLGRGALKQSVSVRLQVELRDSTEVDVTEGRRTQAAEPVIIDLKAAFPQPTNNGTHALGGPSQHDVGQKRMRGRNGHHLVAPTTPLSGNAAAVDRAQQVMHGLTAVQERVDLSPKCLDRKVVAEEQRAKQTSDMLGGPMHVVTCRGWTQALDGQLR
jgi:hypothetical protein